MRSGESSENERTIRDRPMRGIFGRNLDRESFDQWGRAKLSMWALMTCRDPLMACVSPQEWATIFHADTLGMLLVGHVHLLR